MTEEERQSIIDEIKEQLLADMVDITKLPKGDATDGASLPVLQHSELVIQELNNFIGVYDIDVERQSADSDIVNIYLKNAAGVVIKTIVTNAATLEQVNTKVAKINESLTLISSSLSTKQDKLVSGTNIKTINGTSLLGSGDVVVVGGADKHGAAYPDGKTDKPYHKVASVSCAVSATLDTNISFYVSEYYNDTSCGILNISLRWTANSTKFKFNRIFWSLNVGIDVNNFVLGWTVVDGIVTCNLYVKRISWTSYALKRLDEQAWGNSKDLWQCYNATYPNNCYATIPDANTVVSVNEIISNNVNTAKKLTTARTISLGGAARGSTTFDGSADKTLDVRTLYESFLDFGGKSINGGITPIDGAAMGELWCNKFAFYNHDYIHVEYTNNYSEDANGNESADVEWNDYPFSNNAYKDSVLFNMTTLGTSYQSFCVSGSSTAGSAIAGKSRLRVTFDGYSGRYLIGKKILVNVSASGAALGNQILIEHVKKEDYVAGNVNKFTKVSLNTVSGDSGWNSIIYPYVFGSDTYAPYRRIRITFIANGVDSTNRPPRLHSIFMLGRHYAVKDSNVATNGLLYTFDKDQNATFPANVTATKHITKGGTNQQAVLGDGSLKALSEISPITDDDAEILLDNHIHSIDVNANGNNVNINVIESSKSGNNWETEDNDITIPLATPTSAGVMSKEDKAKLDGNISIEPDSGMPDFIGDFEYSDVDYEAIIDLTTIDWINWVEGGLFMMNAEETWEEDNGDTSYHQCIITFIYRANGCIPISIVNTNKMTAKMSGMVITINLTEGTGELRFKQIKLI